MAVQYLSKYIEVVNMLEQADAAYNRARGSRGMQLVKFIEVPDSATLCEFAKMLDRSLVHIDGRTCLKFGTSHYLCAAREDGVHGV